MKTKYSIGFFAVMVIALTLVTGAYQLSYRQAKERLETKTAEETKPREPTAVAADGQALKDGCYYLMEVNGYVVVYMSDKKTPYEYTDIKCDGLPSEMQEEIKNGKYMEDAKALYGFLENYSS